MYILTMRRKDVLMKRFFVNDLKKMVVNTLNFVLLVIECLVMNLSVEGNWDGKGKLVNEIKFLLK